MVAAVGRQEGRIIMSMLIKCVTADEAFYVGCDQRIRIDVDTLIVSLWNNFLHSKGERNRIAFNKKKLIENCFENKFDAAMAASLGNWRWDDRFVYFNSDRYLSSFSHWYDETCPIDIDRIDINYLIRALQDLQTEDKKGYVNNIPKAIHDALKEG